MIFNQVSRSVEDDFRVLLNADFDFDESLYIKKNTLFTDLGLLKKSISDVYNPDLNYYKSRIMSAKDPKEKIILVKSDLANRMAHAVIGHFDYLFEKITGERFSLEDELKSQMAELEKHSNVEDMEVEEKSVETNEDDDDL